MKVNILLVLLFSAFLSGCATNPPKPTLPKGEWVQMNTQVPAAKAQLQKINAAKGD